MGGVEVSQNLDETVDERGPAKKKRETKHSSFLYFTRRTRHFLSVRKLAIQFSSNVSEIFEKSTKYSKQYSTFTEYNVCHATALRYTMLEYPL